jgi:hypothetical protein
LGTSKVIDPEAWKTGNSEAWKPEIIETWKATGNCWMVDVGGFCLIKQALPKAM